MATLDDKLMGEKLHYYCSSSEDEEDDTPVIVRDPDTNPSFMKTGNVNGAFNTGPKGVVKDFMRYKQLETEKRESQNQEKIALAKKLSMSCRTTEEDAKAKADEEKLDEDIEALLDDEFMKMYIQRRMAEMKSNYNSTKHFGTILNLTDGESFLQAIEGEDKNVIVIVFVYEDEADGCYLTEQCLKIIAKEHNSVKITKISASAAGFSKHFKARGVPAILVYKGGDLVTSFPRITEALGDDFFAVDLEDYLIENGVLHEKATSTIRCESDPSNNE